MKTILSLFISLICLTNLSLAQSFPIQELTIDEFIKYERSLGSNIQELDTSEVFLMGVSEDVYPYAASYELDQLYQGKRSVGSDSTVTEFEVFHDKKSRVDKLISYSFRPKAKSPQEIALELEAEEGYSADKFIKRLNEQWSDPAYQQKITEKYETLRKQFAEKGKLIENRERSNGINLTKIKTYKIDQAVVELSITHSEGLNKATNVDIFWE